MRSCVGMLDRVHMHTAVATDPEHEHFKYGKEGQTKAAVDRVLQQYRFCSPYQKFCSVSAFPGNTVSFLHSNALPPNKIACSLLLSLSGESTKTRKYEITARMETDKCSRCRLRLEKVWPPYFRITPSTPHPPEGSLQMQDR